MNTEKVTNMSYMFYLCSNLTNLNISSFNTKNVTDMSYMFYSCRNLTALDISSFDTKNVEDMSSMFYNCYYLYISNLIPNLDKTNLKKVKSMFCGCTDSSNYNSNSYSNFPFDFSSTSFRDFDGKDLLASS